MSPGRRVGKRKFQNKKPSLAYLKGPQRAQLQQDKAILNINRKIRKLEDEVETKYFDQHISLACTTAGTQQCLNGMAVGNNQITRVGAQIKVTSIQLRLTFTSLNSYVGPQTIRVILFWDRESNGAAPTLQGDPIGAGTSALLNQAAIGAANVNNPYQFENKHRFHVLMDKWIVINPLTVNTTAAGVTTVVVPMEKHVMKIKKCPRIVKYDQTTAGIGSINTNSLNIAVFSDFASSSVDGTSRLYFKDP